MKATKKNIKDVLRTNAKGVNFKSAFAGNGFRLKGFLSRAALTDLMNNFHVYVNKGQEVVVISPGMESTKDRL